MVTNPERKTFYVSINAQFALASVAILGVSLAIKAGLATAPLGISPHELVTNISPYTLAIGGIKVLSGFSLIPKDHTPKMKAENRSYKITGISESILSFLTLVASDVIKNS